MYKVVSTLYIMLYLNITNAQHVYTYVERMPYATYNVDSFIAKNLLYPETAKKNGIEGRLSVRLTITETGSIDSAVVVGKRIGAGTEEEAIRIAKLMPSWQPAQVNGKPVRAYYVVPVVFRLDSIYGVTESR